jgi:hypothetical protein
VCVRVCVCVCVCVFAVSSRARASSSRACVTFPGGENAEDAATETTETDVVATNEAVDGGADTKEAKRKEKELKKAEKEREKAEKEKAKREKEAQKKREKELKKADKGNADSPPTTKKKGGVFGALKGLKKSSKATEGHSNTPEAAPPMDADEDGDIDL